MEETYTVGMALFDFIPNIAFLVGAFFLVKLSLLLRGKPCARMLMAGTALVFLGGTLKAAWKLLYAAGIADIQIFSQAQFVLLAPGFLGMLISVVLLAREQRRKGTAPLYLIAPWKIPLLAVMTLASLGAQGILVYVAFRRGARVAAYAFIIAVLCMLGMSGMASGSQTVARQWIEQSINAVGQIAFATGSYLLYRSFIGMGSEVSCV
ncbi:MAG: hypothetical protein RBT75_20095 [Anaerolineae bacterium]|jgi:hypothetical protein|nr:hypothetical protein [Anaerolineae bacterium]